MKMYLYIILLYRQQEQYRYLVQGEYVDFKLCAVSDEAHKWQAGEVSGVDGEKLMCETRLESRATRTNRKETGSDTTRSGGRSRDGQEQSHYRVRSRGSGPREGDEWMLVRRKTLHSSAIVVQVPSRLKRHNAST